MAEKPWFAPGHVDSLSGSCCTPRPRDPLWTLVKGGKRVDAELLFHGELGVEVQFLHEGVMAYGQRFVLREQAVQEGGVHRRRLMKDGWTASVTSPSAE
jgi:hypothetical protein